jgi:CRP-like cAMP-binding protein
MRNVLGLFKNTDLAERRSAGETIFEAGKPGACMYVVRTGRVDIRVGGETVESVEPGGIIGEMSLLDAEPRSASAIAATDCEVVSVDQKRFLFMVQQTPFFALEVMRTMAARLREMNKRVGRSGS